MSEQQAVPGKGLGGVRLAPSGRRAVIVAGARTPFAKAFGELKRLDAIGLAVHAVRGLLERTGLQPAEIDEVCWGSVVVKSQAPNVAREIVFDLNLPRAIPGSTVSQACLSGLRAITNMAAAIERGEIDVAIAGGSDSISHAEMPLPTPLVQALAQLGAGRLTGSRLARILREVGSPRNVIPKRPSIAERATGLTMGQHADDMTRHYDITREEQDAFAARSHERAAAAFRSGRFADELVPIALDGRTCERDGPLRDRVDRKKMATLKPCFRRNGTITAATSTALTDGASAVLLMSEDKAEDLGMPAQVAITDWVYTALDPFDQLLIGPALAIPRLCDRHGLGLADIDVVELHEAFAAQALCVVEALASERFCRERLGRDRAFGAIPEAKLNRHGGSVALGHPFAATGGRLVTTAANELRLTGERRALVAACAGGAMGGAALLERIA